jgi:hypothetical protein
MPRMDRTAIELSLASTPLHQGWRAKACAFGDAVAIIADLVACSKVFVNKLVERGELLQKDAEKWMKDVQARFR